jgi:hypothetical protein
VERHHVRLVGSNHSYTYALRIRTRPIHARISMRSSMYFKTLYGLNTGCQKSGQIHSSTSAMKVNHNLHDHLVPLAALNREKLYAASLDFKHVAANRQIRLNNVLIALNGAESTRQNNELLFQQ